MKPKSEPVGASLSTTLGNCICGHGYASTCPVHGEPLQPDRGELMPLEQISGCIKDFTGGLPLREYLDEINEEDGFPRIAADESDAANIAGNKRGVQTSTLATSDPQLGASLSAQTPQNVTKRRSMTVRELADELYTLSEIVYYLCPDQGTTKDMIIALRERMRLPSR